MAKIALPCGHTLVKSLVGSKEDKERAAALWVIQPCQECEHVAALVEAQSAESDLPALLGTAEDIEQATVVRYKKLKLAREWIDNTSFRGTFEQVEYAERCFEALKQKPDSDWWVNRGGYTGWQVLTAVLQEVKKRWISTNLISSNYTGNWLIW